ncbi:MAG: hypothetical protein M1833_005802 [Piccolia ochrophora]|nr:MAG: hypothetical protein M1833_005802 [Piccolia ochrophora]
MYALEDFGGPQSFVINEAVETFFQERTALSVLRVCKQVCDEARGSLEKSTTHELDVLTQGHWDIEAMRRHFRTGALHGMEAVSISIHCSPAVFREILRYRLETLVSSCLRDIHCPRRLHINVHESLTYAEEQQRANAAEYLLAPFLVLRNIRECEVYCRASVEWLRNFKATTGTESLLQKWLPDERRNPLFNHQQEHKHRGAMTIHRI